MKKKLYLVFAISLVTALVFCGCNNNPQSPDSDPSDSSISEPVSSEEPSDTSSAPTVQIYDPDTQKVSQVPVNGEEGDTVTDELLIAQLNEKFAFTAGGNEFKIIINSVSEKDGGLHVDFAGNSIPAVSMGSSEEEACLISIAETMLQNHPSCTEIYYSIDGGAYMSGHIELDIGEPFRYDSKLA